MKVTDFKTMVVHNEPPYIGGRYLLFLELHTDEGITGLGERITGGAYSQNLADLKTQIGLIEEMVATSSSAKTPSTSRGHGTGCTPPATTSDTPASTLPPS